MQAAGAVGAGRGECVKLSVLFLSALNLLALFSLPLTNNCSIYDPDNGKSCHQCRQKTLGLRTACSRCTSGLVRREFAACSPVCACPASQSCSACPACNAALRLGALSHHSIIIRIRRASCAATACLRGMASTWRRRWPSRVGS